MWDVPDRDFVNRTVSRLGNRSDRLLSEYSESLVSAEDISSGGVREGRGRGKRERERGRGKREEGRGKREEGEGGGRGKKGQLTVAWGSSGASL